MNPSKTNEAVGPCSEAVRPCSEAVGPCSEVVGPCTEAVGPCSPAAELFITMRPSTDGYTFSLSVM